MEQNIKYTWQRANVLQVIRGLAASGVIKIDPYRAKELYEQLEAIDERTKDIKSFLGIIAVVGANNYKGIESENSMN